jgi:hypothetical protein
MDGLQPSLQVERCCLPLSTLFSVVYEAIRRDTNSLFIQSLSSLIVQPTPTIETSSPRTKGAYTWVDEVNCDRISETV